MRQLVQQGTTRPLQWRRQQLDRLAALLTTHRQAVLDALASDLGKPPVEAMIELLVVQQELRLTRQKLRRWMAPRALPSAVFVQPARARLISEPLGCVLIISPWNYPLQLCLHPLVSALAAGNTAVLKPSELAPATAELLASLVATHFPAEVVSVVQGDGATAAALLRERFDHIFFTGSERVGQLVLEAAACHLTPVTLELGGKSPAIVLADAPLTVTARRLIWGKGYNAGQTCVAPDYLLVQRGIAADLIAALAVERQRLYGQHPLESPDLGCMVNRSQFERLESLLQQARQQDRILIGGGSDPRRLRIEPTVLRANGGDEPWMRQELFGPILPLLEIETLDEALTFINQRPKPLALYLFSQDRAAQEQTLHRTSSGTVLFNDVILQAADPNLPFGGVGTSGSGTYHGEAGFRTFSHQRTVLGRPLWGELLQRYPPYGRRAALLQRLLG
ncbi:MAG: aldehyde dehydrogenase family protein [Cyanobacteria bacterium K_DeepCast_35m_m2_023]|nr:aldehyde dehydrogenase family protein [Cyanobacteria bacterium K_DeepCast_35m_m2_023]